MNPSLTRRHWLALASSGACALAANRARAALLPFAAATPPPEQVTVSIDERKPLGAIPGDFLGLGYEISSPARPGLLDGRDSVYVQLVKTLGTRGNIRIGGNTADYASFSPHKPAISAPKGSVVNRQSLAELGAFLKATGWSLIWVLNLGEGTPEEAVEEAQAVVAAVGKELLAFEIGNEVDLFTHEGHRKPPYTFANYLEQYRTFKAAIRARLPGVPFAGPDVATDTGWVRDFAAAEAPDIKLLTHHYYRGGQGSASSLAMLFNPDPKLAPVLTELQQISRSSGIPYRICETNSFSGGGKPGVSGTFGAALWVLDYMIHLATFDAAGINLETGVNQLGFVSSYSPIGDNEHGTYTATPEFYGMLAFAQGSRGHRLATEADTAGLNLTAFATSPNPRELTLTLINKESTRPATVNIRCDAPIRRATTLRLTAPSLTTATGLTLGGAPVIPDGRWTPKSPEPVPTTSAGLASLSLPPASAAIVTLLL